MQPHGTALTLLREMSACEANLNDSYREMLGALTVGFDKKRRRKDALSAIFAKIPPQEAAIYERLEEEVEGLR